MFTIKRRAAIFLISTTTIIMSGSTAFSEGSISFARVDPLVIRAGENTFRLTIGVSSPAVESIVLDDMVPSASRYTQNGKEVSAFVLRDDGTTGDLFPNDGVFTAANIGLVDTNGLLGHAYMHRARFTYQFRDGTTATGTEDLGLTFRFMDPSVPRASFVPDLAADVRRSTSVVSIVLPPVGVFPNLLFDKTAAAQRYYDFLPDDRDILMFGHIYNSLANSADATIVKNDVHGIGTPIVDFSSIYGSRGVLQLDIRLAKGSVADFTILNHEILHRWAARIELDLSEGGNHWGVIERVSSGFGSGYHYNKIELISEGTYLTIAQHDIHYNDLELYLAGLMELSEILSPIRALVNPVRLANVFCPPEYIPCNAVTYTADALREVTTDEILSLHGPRIPEPPQAQRHFRSGLIVVYDRLLSRDELAFFEFAMKEFESYHSDALPGITFREATHNRATLSTRLICADLDGDGLCEGVDNCPELFNYDQADADLDQQGDPCDACPLDPTNVDTDGDGVCDLTDSCPDDPNDIDVDLDGHCDVLDNCPTRRNASQQDSDGDGEGDVCDVNDGLIVVDLLDAMTLSWQKEPQYQSFNVYRSDLQTLKSTGLYTQDPRMEPLADRNCKTRVSFWDDSFLPPLNQALVYWVTGNEMGKESSLGNDSDGNLRPNEHSCP